MTRTVTAAAQTALTADNVPGLVFVELDFSSGFVRATNAGHTVTWNGYNWVGLGLLGGVDAVEERSEIPAKGITFRLAGVDSSVLAITLGEHYQGRSARVWFAPLDSDHKVIADPVLVFSGRMDNMRVQTGKTATVSVSAESRMADWERPRVRRYNDADQQAEFSGDLGFAFVESFAAGKEIVWGRA